MQRVRQQNSKMFVLELELSEYRIVTQIKKKTLHSGDALLESWNYNDDEPNLFAKYKKYLPDWYRKCWIFQSVADPCSFVVMHWSPFTCHWHTCVAIFQQKRVSIYVNSCVIGCIAWIFIERSTNSINKWRKSWSKPLLCWEIPSRNT